MFLPASIHLGLWFPRTEKGLPLNEIKQEMKRKSNRVSKRSYELIYVLQENGGRYPMTQQGITPAHFCWQGQNQRQKEVLTATDTKVSNRSRAFIMKNAAMSDERSLYNSVGGHVCVLIQEQERQHDISY